MNINWKYAIINTAIAGTFGIITGKLINLVEYYKGLSEGIMDGAKKGADELEAKYMEILAMKEKENEELKKKTGVEIPTVKEFIHRNDIQMPEPNELGKLTMLWDEGDGPLFAAEDIKINDAEKFLAGLQKHLEGIDPKYKGNDMVSIAVAGFHTKEV